MLKVSRPRAPTRRGALISHLIAPLAPPCYGWSTRRRHHHHPTTLPTCLLLHSKTPQPSHPIRREMMIQRYWRPVKMTEALCAKTNAEIAKISAKHENDVKLSIPNRIHVANVIAAALSCLDEKCSTLPCPLRAIVTKAHHNPTSPPVCPLCLFSRDAARGGHSLLGSLVEHGSCALDLTNNTWDSAYSMALPNDALHFALMGRKETTFDEVGDGDSTTSHVDPPSRRILPFLPNGFM